MLKLENVSKFYASNGVVTSGFSKVNLEFEVGEFVAITGESGSGKSTLLNVISGLDSYEEGEMYIYGEPTSGYGGADLEEYRKKYIGNIFQTFHLINNYTVYQNVEMVLLLSGYQRDEIKDRIDDLIQKVGLENYRNTKASKLSGGQKQRVAIARALAKETPIIIADEPTGNLDVASAEEIIKLLANLSKDKLIIIVTHNYEQVENYATRKITMYDGKLMEDKKFERQSAAEGLAQEHNEELNLVAAEEKSVKHDGLGFGNMLLLGLRNSFSIPAKLFLLMAVFLFLIVGIFSQYSAHLSVIRGVDTYSYNPAFSYNDPKRIVVTKQDKTAITDQDYKELENISTISSIVKEDYLLDQQFFVSDATVNNQEKANYSFTAKVQNLTDYDKVDVGRVPEEESECLMIVNDKEEYSLQIAKEVIDEQLYLQYGSDIERKIKVVGLVYDENSVVNVNRFSSWVDGILLCDEKMVEQLQQELKQGFLLTELKLGDRLFNLGANEFLQLVPSEKVEKGKAYITSILADCYPNGDFKGKTIEILRTYKGSNNNYPVEVIGEAYSGNSENLLAIKDSDFVEGLYINPEDYNRICETENYQISVFVEHENQLDKTIEELEKAGFKALSLYKVNIEMNDSLVRMISTTMQTIASVAMLCVLFFISYFIIKLIFKSRNIYFATVRMLGGRKKSCVGILMTELFVVFHIVYAFSMLVLIFTKLEKVELPVVTKLAQFLTVQDFIIVYFIVLLMTILLALRYSGQMFRKTAMNAYKEEV